jgi:hypothetical protein
MRQFSKPKRNLFDFENHRSNGKLYLLEPGFELFELLRGVITNLKVWMLRNTM